MPKTTELATVFKSNAFISGATTVMAALLESDQDPKTVSRIQKSICMQSIPLGLLADNPEETAIAFEDEAVKGLQAHPEIRDHLDYIAEYYAKTTKDTIYGRDVCTGAGFYLSRLDRSYASVINQDISKWLGVEVEKIDWDKLFE